MYANFSIIFGRVTPYVNGGTAMMLFIKDKQGVYSPATTQVIIKAGRSLTRAALRKGTDFISSPKVAKEAIASLLANNQREIFGCLFLDNKNRILKWKELFYGTINTITVYHREIVKEALRLNAAGVILAHNHPSGNCEPSQKDIELTIQLTEILMVVEVKVLDHIVVGEDIVSFHDRGLCIK